MTTKVSTGYTPFPDEPAIPPPDGALGPVSPKPPVEKVRYDPNTGKPWTITIPRSPINPAGWQKKQAKELKTDPHWCKVSLLLNFNYVPGWAPQRVEDASQYENRVYMGSGASAGNRITTEQSPFGSTSFRFFDSSTNIIVVFPNKSLNVAYDDFTVETWIFLTEDQNAQVRNIYRTWNQNNLLITNFGIGANGRLFYSHYSNGTMNANTELQVGQWYHVAVSRTQDVVRFFVNGTLDGTITGVGDPSSFIGESLEAWIGGSLDAFVDEFRVTKGIGRYVRDFEVPDSDFEIELSSDTKRDYYWDKVVALFNMDYPSGEDSITDKSQNSIEATLHNNASLSDYDKKFGNAALFRSSGNDYLSCTDPSFSIAQFEDFTIESWVKILLLRDSTTSSANGTGNIFKLSNLSLNLEDENFVLTLNGASTILGSCSVSNGTIGQWMHVALAREGDKVRLWVNGKQSGETVDDAGAEYPGNSLMIGKDLPTQGGQRPLIDDFRFTKGVARYLAQQGSFIPPSEAFPTQGETEPDPYYTNVVLSILSNYHQTGATQFIDSSLNAATITTVGSPIVTDSEKVFRASFHLPSGSAMVVSSAGAGGSSSEDFTLEAWVNLPAIGAGTKTVVGFPAARLSIVSGLLSWKGGAIVAVEGNEITAGQWTHVALSREDGKIRMFKDGQLLQTDPLTLTDQTYVDYETMYVGAKQDGVFVNFLDGFIDQIRVTRGIARYTASFPTPFRPFGNSGCFKIYTGLLLPSSSVFPVPTQVYN